MMIRLLQWIDWLQSKICREWTLNFENSKIEIEVLACAERYQILDIAFVTSLSLKFTIEFRHSWYLETFEVYFHVQTASKNEAI